MRLRESGDREELLQSRPAHEGAAERKAMKQFEELPAGRPSERESPENYPVPGESLIAGK